MKKSKLLLLLLVSALLFASCGKSNNTLEFQNITEYEYSAPQSISVDVTENKNIYYYINSFWKKSLPPHPNGSAFYHDEEDETFSLIVSSNKSAFEDENFNNPEFEINYSVMKEMAENYKELLKEDITNANGISIRRIVYEESLEKFGDVITQDYMFILDGFTYNFKFRQGKDSKNDISPIIKLIINSISTKSQVAELLTNKNIYVTNSPITLEALDNITYCINSDWQKSNVIGYIYYFPDNFELRINSQTVPVDIQDGMAETRQDVLRKTSVNYKELVCEKITNNNNIIMHHLQYEENDIVTNNNSITDEYIFFKEDKMYYFTFQKDKNIQQDISSDVEFIINSIS